MYEIIRGSSGYWHLYDLTAGRKHIDFFSKHEDAVTEAKRLGLTHELPAPVQP